LDAVHFKVREDGVIITKAVYSCYGITSEGDREILGLWIGEREGAKFWLGVCADLQQRGVKDILITCMDGLKGLPEAIESIFPQVSIQLCVVHQIRNSLKYIPTNRYKEFLSDLKSVYQAPSEKVARENLNTLEEKWGAKYPHAVASWVNNWDRICTYFQYPAVLRKLIYTTNAVEALHRQMRKVTKAKGAFPTKGSLFKMLYLAVRDIDAKRKRVNGWKEIFSSLAIIFGDRVTSIECA
jgi:putative transposase